MTQQENYTLVVVACDRGRRERKKRMGKERERGRRKRERRKEGKEIFYSRGLGMKFTGRALAEHAK